MKHYSIHLIICGEEILSGKRQDSHIKTITSQLKKLGLDCTLCTVVGDKISNLSEIIRSSLRDADIVIITGGLGPTIDDITREAISDATSIGLHLDPLALKMIQDRFTAFNRPMTDNNKRQAYIPDEGFFIYNPNGTAPGLVFEPKGKAVIALPGPPRELVPMLNDDVVPYLQKRYSLKPLEISSSFHFACLGESNIDHYLREEIANSDDLAISSLSKPGHVELTLTLPDTETNIAKLQKITDKITHDLGDSIFSKNNASLESVVLQLLRERKQTLSLAESCTGGMLGQKLTAIPGSSDVLVGGLIAYQNDIKQSLLGVRSDTLQIHGAVSLETSCQMALGAIKCFKSNWGIGITGIAGPGGGTEKKPVGTVWVTIANAEGKTYPMHLTFPGKRNEIRSRSTVYAIDQLRRLLLNLKLHT